MAGALFIGAGIISELAHVIYLVKEKRKQSTEDSQTSKIWKESTPNTKVIKLRFIER